jgi:hypothetical protein
MRSRTRRRQEGSVFIVALLALVVLSAVGLGVALITQTEMQIGANERTVQRVFYAADAGLETATACALVAADYFAKTLSLPDPDNPTGFDLHHQVETSPFYPILDSPCNLCEINNAGTYEADACRRMNNAVTVYARRVGGVGTIRFAEKPLTTMVEVQPSRVTSEAYRSTCSWSLRARPWPSTSPKARTSPSSSGCRCRIRSMPRTPWS